MNRSFIGAVFTVAMIIMSTSVGHTAPPHDFDCDNCHGKEVGSGVVAMTNACLGCHNSEGAASRMPVDQGAMSNYFGAVAGQPATGSKSSHTFLTTAPYSPAALVQEPTNASLNSSNHQNAGSLVGTLICERCHFVAPSTTNSGFTKPFLRISNANDALCFQCHLQRNTQSHATGSHPVFSRAYSSVYRTDTTAFRRVPLSPNSNNPTAMLGNYLTGGRVACSTCHGVHYADSNSATLDNRSTANGFAQDNDALKLKGQLQNSKGQLLRTDPIGADANAINVCSSCHKETKNRNHNGKGQNVQCDQCHGAHVDYTGDTSLPNLYLVRRDFSNISIASGKAVTAGKRAIYNSATSLRFKRADGNGICQVCHNSLPTNIEAHSATDIRKADCVTCHNHSNGFSASDCSACHGQPPMANYVGGPKGKALQSYTLDEGMTPHATHADAGYYKYACKNCHYDGTKAGYHNTGSSFSDVFIDTTGSVGDQLATGGPSKNLPGDYNATAKTCSNVYCHSNGNPRVVGIDWKSPTHETPTWTNGKNTIVGTASECTTCHEYGATLVTNAHNKHVATNNIKCFVCHAATATQTGSIADRTKHANGAKDVVFAVRPTNFQSVFEGSFDTATANCTNSCHTNGLGGSPATTPKWTVASTGQCGSCHAQPPTTSLHSMHFTDIIGPKLNAQPSPCVNCHIYAEGAATHANGVVDLKAGNSCAPCHPGGAPIWSTTSTVTCESCHTGTASVVGIYTAPLKDLNATSGHGQYSSAALAKVRCTTCHNAAADHIGATDKRLLIAGNGLCNSCHTTAAGKGLPDTRVDLPVHGGTVNKFFKYTSAADFVRVAAVRPDSCAGCHDTHGTTNRMSIRTVIDGEAVSYTGVTPNFIVLTPNGNNVYNGLCQICHTKTKYFNRNAPPVTSHASGKCLDCHKHKAEHYAFEPGGSCGGCHGYPPVRAEITRLAGTIGTQGNYSSAKFQDYSGGGGAHAVAGHISKSVVQQGGKDSCTNCHYDFDNSHNKGGSPIDKNFVNVVVNPKFKFNNATSIVYNNSNCSNVSCHFRPSPNWKTGQ
jgi:predicted CxxxxCH...CXXCH cytochrome family protein